VYGAVQLSLGDLAAMNERCKGRSGCCTPRSGAYRINRFMCVQIPHGGSNADEIVRQSFRILPTLEAAKFPLRTICSPVLGAGLHGLNVSNAIPPIVGGGLGSVSMPNPPSRSQRLAERPARPGRHPVAARLAKEAFSRNCCAYLCEHRPPRLQYGCGHARQCSWQGGRTSA
jgi:hypothetical protein